MFYYKIEHYPGKTATKWSFWVIKYINVYGTETPVTIAYSAGHNSLEEAECEALAFLEKYELHAERIKK